MSNKPNVLLLVLDSVRAKNTSLHGYDRETTPFLEELANEATVYTQARSPSIHSIASHVSMFTGFHVEEHNAINHSDRIDTSDTIWKQLESASNYATGLFTNNAIVARTSNLDEAFQYTFTPKFQTFSERLPDAIFERAYYPGRESGTFGVKGHAKRSLSDDAPVRSLLNCTYEQVCRTIDYVESGISDRPNKLGFKWHSGETYTDAFLDWKSGQDEPWAACINLMDTHSPYVPAPEFNRWSSEDVNKNPKTKGRLTVDSHELTNGEGWEQFETLEPLYDGTILQADSIARDLMSGLERGGSLDNTLVIITSDHGEGFGEQSRVDPDVGLSGHSWGLHEVLTHVPLVIKYPGQTGGRTIERLVSLTDLPEMIQSIADGEPKHLESVSGEPVLASTFRLFEEAVDKQEPKIPEQYIGPFRAVYENHDGTVRKYIQKRDKYATIDIHDPHDIRIISRDERSKVEEVYGQLSEQPVRVEKETGIDEAVEEHLEELGYVR